MIFGGVDVSVTGKKEPLIICTFVIKRISGKYNCLFPCRWLQLHEIRNVAPGTIFQWRSISTQPSSGTSVSTNCVLAIFCRHFNPILSWDIFYSPIRLRDQWRQWSHDWWEGEQTWKIWKACIMMHHCKSSWKRNKTSIKETLYLKPLF